MNFEPKTEEQLIEESLFPAGEYDFDVIEAKEGVSKNGNDMLIIELLVYRDDGRTRKITDYITEAMGFKLRHICETVGIIDIYETGALTPEHLTGRSGRVKLRVKQDAGYAPKNEVADYAKPEAQSRPRSTLPRNTAAVDLNDEMPFM